MTLRDLLPRVTTTTGKVVFKTYVPDPVEAERQRRVNARANLITESWCLCSWYWERNGDPYEDERRRGDNEACPVHGRNPNEVD